jgi:hypothetical protein
LGGSWVEVYKSQIPFSQTCPQGCPQGCPLFPGMSPGMSPGMGPKPGDIPGDMFGYGWAYLGMAGHTWVWLGIPGYDQKTWGHTWGHTWGSGYKTCFGALGAHLAPRDLLSAEPARGALGLQRSRASSAHARVMPGVRAGIPAAFAWDVACGSRGGCNAQPAWPKAGVASHVRHSRLQIWRIRRLRGPAESASHASRRVPLPPQVR